jgi:hypothetical protein
MRRDKVGKVALSHGRDLLHDLVRNDLVQKISYSGWFLNVNLRK